MESAKLSALASFAANQDDGLPLAVSKNPVRSTSGKAIGKASPLGPIDSSSAAAGVLSHKQSVALDTASPTTAATAMLTRSPTSSGGGRSPSHKLTAIPLVAPAMTSVSIDMEPQSAAVAAQTPLTVNVRRGSSLRPLKSVEGPETAGKGNNDAEIAQTGEPKALQSRQEERTAPDPPIEVTGNGAGNTLKGDAGPGQKTVADKPTSAARATDVETNSENGDFDFDGEDSDEKAELRPTERSSIDKYPPPPTKTSGTRAEAIDIEELYDAPSDFKGEDERLQRPRVQPRMFLPKASDIELFHAVLTQDVGCLRQYLQDASPVEVLDVVDSTGRSLYHYAALSRNKEVRNLVFQHANSYQDQQLELEIQQLMRKKEHLHSWMEETRLHGRGWVPPRVKELQREVTKRKCEDWERICSSVDQHNRSFLHYIARTLLPVPLMDDYEFCSVLRANPTLLGARDRFEKTALYYAVEAGNLQQVKWYFRMGVRLTQADVDSLLSLNVSRAMETALLRQLEALDSQKYYLASTTRGLDGEQEPGCDPGVSSLVLAKAQRTVDESSGRLHQQPLHRAAMYGNLPAVELLLEKGANPGARDANGWTALHYCADEATSNHLAIAERLVEAPASVGIDTRSVKGRSPLHVAARSYKHQISDSDSKRPASQAWESDDRIAFLAFLLRCKAEIDLKDSRGATPLLLACRGGQVGVARFLLSAGCDPTAVEGNGSNALHVAATRGKPDMMWFLVSWDADLRFWADSTDQRGRKPLDVAKNQETRQILTNLWTSCYHGNVDHVKNLLLCMKKHDVKARDRRRHVATDEQTVQTERTPLHLAVLGYVDVMRSEETRKRHSSQEQEQRLKRERVAESKQTAPNRFLQIAVLLLQAGADSCVGDKWGITSLMLAAGVKDAVFMGAFLERIADAEGLMLTDVDGNTALHYSYAFCQANISTMLEEQMEEVDIENKQGKLPLEMTAYRDKILPAEYRQFIRRTCATSMK